MVDTLTYAQVEGYWDAAGGPPSLASTMAAVSSAESSLEPTAIQPGQPYATRGWGLWQITPGDSEPQYGTDNQLLDPYANAEAAVAKYKAQGLGAWTTYTGGRYLNFLQSGVTPAKVSTKGGAVPAASAGPGGLTVDAGAGGAAGVNPTGFLSSLDGLLNPSTASGISELLHPAGDVKAVAQLILARGVVCLLGGLVMLSGVALVAAGPLLELVRGVGKDAL